VRPLAARLRRDREVALLAVEGELVLAVHGDSHLLACVQKLASTSPAGDGGKPCLYA
jgi:hypothetical protein